MRGFLNSLIITFCGVMVNLIVTLPTSYALSRSNFSGKKPITIFYLITMFFGGGLIPTYLVIQRLQMLNTIWALILPGCLSVYNMIVARTFFKSNISEELYEAAEIDGCTQARFFSRLHFRFPKRSSQFWFCTMVSVTGTHTSQHSFIFRTKQSIRCSWFCVTS